MDTIPLLPPSLIDIHIDGEKWTREDWYAVMQTVCAKLNQIHQSSDLLHSIMPLFFPCQITDPVDMTLLNGSNCITNFCGLLNGLLAFRDSQNRTYRIAPVFLSDDISDKALPKVSHFVVTVNLSHADDNVFPLHQESV